MNIAKLKKALSRNEFAISCFEDKEAAAIYLNNAIDRKTVGLGDFATLLSMRLYDLRKIHNTVHDPAQMEVVLIQEALGL